MKKILTWLLILSLLMMSMLTMTACLFGDDDGEEKEDEVLSEEEVEDLLAATEEKMEDLDDLEMRATLNIKMATQGVTVEIPMSMALKMDDYRGENPAMAMTLNGELMGEVLNYGMYYKDGWAYVIEDGESYKQQMENPFAELDTEMPAIDGETVAMLEQLWANMLKNADAVTKSNGSTVIEFDMDLQELMTAFSALMENVGDMGLGDDMGLGGDMGLGDMSAMTDMMDGSLKLKLTVKNEYITKVTVDLSMNMEVEGQTTTVDMDVALELVDPGKSVTVTLPAGAESFEELSSDPVSLIDEAIDAMLELDTYSMAVDMSYLAQSTGVTMEVEGWVYIDVRNDGDADNTELAMEVGTVMGDREQVRKTYYLDGWYYYVDGEGNGTREQEPMSYEYGYISALAEMMEGMTAEQFRGADVTMSDGMVIITVEPVNNAGAFIPDMALSFEDSLDAPATFSDVSVTVLLADGYIVSYQVTFVANGTSDGTAVTYEADVSYLLYAMGDDVVVEMPDGREDFAIVN